MKLLLLFTSLFYFVYNGTSQSFEGFITYQTIYQSNLDQFTTKEYFGQEESLDTCYYKDGYYSLVSTTDFIQKLLWRSEDTMHYFFHTHSKDTIWYERTDSKSNKMDSINLEYATDTLLNLICNKLTVYIGKTIYTYYYSPLLKMDPKYYKQYKQNAKNQIVSLMKAPYLKINIVAPQGEITMTSTEIRSMEIPKHMFNLPEGTYLKLPY